MTTTFAPIRLLHAAFPPVQAALRSAKAIAIIILMALAASFLPVAQPVVAAPMADEAVVTRAMNAYNAPQSCPFISAALNAGEPVEELNPGTIPGWHQVRLPWREAKIGYLRAADAVFLIQEDGSTVVQGAAPLFTTPYDGCPTLLGAIETGRSYSVIETRPGWIYANVAESGVIWLHVWTP